MRPCFNLISSAQGAGRPFERPPTPMTATRHIIEALSGPGWCVLPDFVHGEPLRRLQRAVREPKWHDGFRPAGIGQGLNRTHNPQVRGDHIRWLDPAERSGALGHYLGRLENLRLELNRHLFLGLFDFEGHAALYPPGSHYRRHLDRFRGDGRRTVTAILYLNDEWQPEQGGQLRIYIDEKSGNYVDVLPHAGQLVTFLSAVFEHEVLPAERERLSITGWFKQRGDRLQ